ncbi:argininosuccinate synthase [Bacillus cereus]|nr:argininosuccinate synthase [Bacillus cereus]
MKKILSTYDEIKGFKGEKAVLLFSGGLDSMYAAITLRQLGLEVYGLIADVGQSIRNENLLLASQKGIYLRKIDLKETLANQFISQGIQSNALYNQHFPLSSAYTRPAIANEAVKFAQEINSRIIIHSSTPFQNSATRFNLSIMALDPKLYIFCPAIGEYISREEKERFLENEGIHFSKENKPVYSIDENIWARVIENDTIESPWIDLPKEGVFEWTVDPHKCKESPTEISITFELGLPKMLNGKPMDLLPMIQTLNQQLGQYGIGRYNGLEDGLFGVKNPEVREAPAAEFLHKSHLLLEEVILTKEELALKKVLDNKWTELVALGKWFSKIKEHLDASIQSFNQNISGTLKWRVYPGTLLCISKQSDHGLYSANVPRFVEEFQPYTLNSFYNQLGREYH